MTRPANVMATIAVFLVLGGGAAVAAGGLGKNTVGAKQLKPNAVTAVKIKDGAVSAAKLNGSAKTTLTGRKATRAARSCGRKSRATLPSSGPRVRSP